MAKKKRDSGRPQPDKAAAGAFPGAARPLPGPVAAAGGRRARLYWVSGLLLAAAGYVSLTRADAGGQNGWAWAAAVCLLAGYLLFIPAIISTYRR